MTDDYDVKGATLHDDTVENCFTLHVRTKPAVENDEADTGDAKHASVRGVDHQWAFYRLYEYVTSKAESEGLVVTQINPADTNQRCSKCGFTHEENRPHTNGQDEFECLKCGYEVRTDYNTAKNIGLTYLCDQQQSGRGGAPVGVRLNSGMMTVNASLRRPLSAGRTGVHAECHVLQGVVAYWCRYTRHRVWTRRQI